MDKFVLDTAEPVRERIPTTFVPLAPERIIFDPGGVDLLYGVFHIMWSDMPTRRAYGIRLADWYTAEGNHYGCVLLCTFPKDNSISCEIPEDEKLGPSAGQE